MSDEAVQRPGGLTVTDDRGRQVRALLLADLKPVGDAADIARAVLAKRIRDGVRTESRRQSVARIAVIIVLAVVLAGGTTYVSFVFFGPRMPASTPVFWVGIVGITLLMRAWARRAVKQEISATAIAEGFCGSCGYTLASLTPADDTCIQCPECGAAWRANRLTQPYWLQSKQDSRSNDVPWVLRFFAGIQGARNRVCADDRGRFMPILDSRLWALPDDRRIAIGVERIAATRRRLRRIGRIRRILLSMIPLTVSVLTGMIAFSERDNVVVISLACISFFFGIVTIAVAFGHQFYSLRRAARVLADRGLCASCGQCLLSAPADSDGCTVCSDCGAAWRIPTPDAASIPATPSPPSPTIS